MSQNPNRHYTEKEVGILLKRATELQEATDDGSEGGLSLDEVKQIASEIGIDFYHLNTAANELELFQDSVEQSRLWGGPFLIEKKYIIGSGITEAQWERMVEAIRELTGSEGTVSSFGTAVEWSRSIPDIERLQVTVSRGENRSSINIRERYKSGALFAYFFTVLLSLGGGLGIALGLDVSLLAGGIIVGGTATGMLSSLRIALGAVRRKQQKKIKRIMDRLVNIAGDGDLNG